jgi:hypothetical protein
MHETPLMSNSRGHLSRPQTRRRFGRAVSRVVLFGMAIACATLVACKKLECTRTWTSDGNGSPDGKWLAEVREDVCDAGLGAADDVTVVLRPAGAPGDATVVLAPSGQWKDAKLIRPQWLSAQTLEITVPNRTVFGTQLSRYGGVDIVIRYEQDDPTDRARWLAWRTHNIDQVNQRSGGPRAQPPPSPK